MHLFTNVHESVTQAGRHWFGVSLPFGPLIVLADEVGLNSRLICEVVRYGAVDLLQTKKLEILADGLGRLTPAERMDNRIQ